jgi:predicted nucleic acid-binding protein
MRPRFRLYLDTSFWNRLGDLADMERRLASYRFLNRSCQDQTLLISPLVLDEIDETPEPRERVIILRQLQSNRPTVVSGRQRVARIALALREEGDFGERMLADLTHVAYAISSRADALVTWDHRTLARDKVRRIAAAYCKREGMECPLLGLPTDVTTWLELRT